MRKFHFVLFRFIQCKFAGVISGLHTSRAWKLFIGSCSFKAYCQLHSLAFIWLDAMMEEQNPVKNPVKESNSPFAQPGHMVQNYTFWWASCTVGLQKQCNCATCSPVFVILCHVTRSCKGPIGTPCKWLWLIWLLLSNQNTIIWNKYCI